MIKITFKIKISTNFNSPFQILVNLDKAFDTDPYIFSKKDVEHEVKFELDKYPKEAKEDPCLILHTYLKRESDSTLLRTGIYKLTFNELMQKAYKYILKIPHEKLIKADIFISNLNIDGDFKHKLKPMIHMTSDMINKNANSVFQYLSDNFNFSRLSKVAIFYREGLLYRMSLLSQLLGNDNKTNEAFWGKILGYMQRNIELLSNYHRGEQKKQIKKPRPLDVKTSWVDLVSYIVTKGYNYRTDYPKDNYSEPYFNKSGDCIANYEKIYTIDGLKKVGDLKVGDVVLSYCFKTKSSVYKPITKIWEKGILPIKRVTFRNGTHVDVTDKHPFWMRLYQGTPSKYEKKYLCDIDLKHKFKRKTPTFKKIPYVIKDYFKLTENHCFLIGFYLADGWKHNYHVHIGSKKVPDLIVPILNDLNIPYSTGITNSNVPYVTILRSKFKNYLKGLKNNSFDMKLYDHLLSLPENKLTQILNGYFEGDGHFHRQGNKFEKIYSTSCEYFADQLLEISLKIGNPLYKYKQEKHQGLGNKPIYRLHDNSKSFFKRNYGYENLSEVSIKSIEDKGVTQMRDFEVQDTHAYVFKNGVIGHNCEDLGLAILHLYSCFIKSKFQNEILEDMRLNAIQYIPFFTFCVTQQKQFGLGGKPSLSGHVLAIFIKKKEFYNRLQDKELQEKMKLDISNSTTDEFPILLGEGTSNVKPYVGDTNYTGYEGEHYSIIRKLFKIKSRINFKEVNDNIGIRVISDPNSSFYSYFGMLFTNYFCQKKVVSSWNKIKKNVYGFICATHNPHGKPFYGINFNNMSTYSPDVRFYSMPQVDADFINISRKNNRYQIPLPKFMYNGNGFEKGNQGENFYNFDYNSKFFKKLRKYKVNGEIKNIMGYNWFSDEDLLNNDIQDKLLDVISSNKLKVHYERQQLNYDTSTHFFIYGKEKDQIPYVEVMPASNKFLEEM